MRHCIGTYAVRCAAGQMAVVSFRPTDWQTTSRGRLTLLVDARERALREVRGGANRLPTPREWPVLRDYARRAKIDVFSAIRRMIAP